VTAATRASKSQLYHYFGDKHGLLEAVVRHQSAVVLGFHARALTATDSWERLERWAAEMVEVFERQGSRGGCPIGTLGAALSDSDELLRGVLNEAFNPWRQAISGALVRLRDNQLLADEADIEALTTTTLAAIQGGLLLAKTMRDTSQLRVVLYNVVAHLRAYAPPDAQQNPAQPIHDPARDSSRVRPGARLAGSGRIGNASNLRA